MSQNIKNTLYRFVTLRTAELIDDQKKSEGYVAYPSDPVDSMILYASKTAGTKEDKIAAINTAVDAYQLAYPKLDDLKSILTGFADFAKWLTANRKTLTADEVDQKVTALESDMLTSSQLFNVWDDLHHNILTHGSPYVRDLLLSYIVADFFLKEYQLRERSDTSYRALAQSRVVIDKDIFLKADQTTTIVQKSLAQSTVIKETDIAVALEQNEQLATVLNELEYAEQIYLRETQKAQEAYQKTYDAAVKLAYDNATVVERVVTNPDTGETKVVKEYENLVLPEYDFTPTNELEDTNVINLLSTTTASYLDTLKNSALIDTLDEARQLIQKDIDKNLKTIGDYTDLGTKQVNVLGTTLQVKSASSANPFGFTCRSISLVGSDTYSIILTISLPDASYDVSSMIYHLNFADTTNNTNGVFKQSKFDNRINLSLYNGVVIDKATSGFNGEITFANGAKYSFNITGFDVNQTHSGTLSLISGGEETPDEFEAPTGFGIQRLGIADYRKVEQEICCYVPGEVSHIENVMAREYKEKSSRRLRRQEDTLTSSREQESERLTESVSTGRFEMNQEIASIMAQDQSIAASTGVSYNNQGFGLSANASYANNTSKEESNIQAISEAKELTERALDRVVQKVREERVTKVIEEYEENSSHGFDNRKGDKHVSGVYRWIDKIYNNRILNYGKRLMYEFMVPEPATFHDLAVQFKGENDEEVLVRPVDPRTASGSFRMRSYKDITDSTLAHWSGVYNVPIQSKATVINVSDSFSVTGASYLSNHNYPGASNFSIQIPEGYKAMSAYVNSGYTYIPDRVENSYATIAVGNKSFTRSGNKWDDERSFTLGGVENELAVSVIGTDVGGIRVNVVARCEITATADQQWKIDAFNAIIDAYEDKLAVYEEKANAQKAAQKEALKTNPLFYRQIEKTVLRKNCITYLLGNENLGLDFLSDREDIKSIRANTISATLDSYAAKVKFFEQAFEWDIMNYQFYPFYWGTKENWVNRYTVENDDPLFKAFLQSGMARVVVTVRPGFEEMVNWYLATGQIWNGGQAPTIDDPEFVSIVEELRNPESVVEETWETRVPTALTIIQAGSVGLNVQGLPCNTECEDWTQFESDRNPIEQTGDLIGGSALEGVDYDIVGTTAIR